MKKLKFHFKLAVYSPADSKKSICESEQLTELEQYELVDIPEEIIGQVVQKFTKIYGPDVRMVVLPNDEEWAKKHGHYQLDG